MSRTLKVAGAGGLLRVADHSVLWICSRIDSISDDAEGLDTMGGRDWWRAAEAHTGAHWRNENIAVNLEGGYRPPFQIPFATTPRISDELVTPERRHADTV